MSMFKYECDEVKKIIDEVSPNYPQLTTFEKEWLYFHKYGYIPGIPVNLEYATVETSDRATVHDTIPYSYKSAILKGNTGYRDIDTGEFLETLEEGRNLELVSVKMPVLKTTGKNLFNVSKLNGLHENIKMIPNGIRIKNMVINNISDCFAQSFKENTQYTISFNHTQIEGTGREGFIINYTDGTYSNAIPSSNSLRVFSSLPGKTISSIGLTYNDIGVSELTNIQLEEGSTATSYEPFKSNILTVNEEVELREIDDVKDELNLLTGELTTRTRKVVYNSNDIIVAKYRSKENTFTLLFNDKSKDTRSIMADKIPVVTVWSSFLNNFNLCCSSLSSSYIYITIPNVNTPEEAKTYLLNLNPTFLYILAEESVKTVGLTDKLPKPYEGTNHYETYSDTIQPIMFLEVPVVSKGNKTLLDIQNQD